MRHDAPRDLKSAANFEYLSRRISEIEAQNQTLFILLRKFLIDGEIGKPGTGDRE
jgi:hypothetical protein